MTRAPDRIVKLLHDCERIARLSDRVVKIGPLNLGIDSALAILPVGGGLYTIGLGAWLVYMGHRAEASAATLTRMAAYVGVDAVTAAVPVLGSVVDMLFPGHILAVRALRAELERRYGPLPAERTARRRRRAGLGGRFREHPARA
jgi:hypothetical protein